MTQLIYSLKKHTERQHMNPAWILFEVCEEFLSVFRALFMNDSLWIKHSTDVGEHHEQSNSIDWHQKKQPL